jgi:predicted nucleic acid-binding Zn ribbon protein
MFDKPMTKNCPECGNIILGRLDKKFCSDMCRNTYNNRLKADSNNTVRNINNVLKKNRRILEEICPEDKYKTTRATLLKKGFAFNQITHFRKTQNGSTYYFVYDYGYLELDNDYILIVKDNRSKDIS